MHTEMKYRFLIHYTLSFIGGYLGLYAIVSRADLFGNAQTANLLGVVRDIIGRDFSDMMLRVGALLIYMTAVVNWRRLLVEKIVELLYPPGALKVHHWKGIAKNTG